MATKGTTYNFYKDLPPWAKGVSVVFVLGIITVIAFSVRKFIKNQPPKVKYPNNGQGIPAGWDAAPLAKELHDVMSGLFTFTGTKDVAFKKLHQIPTDDMFVAVYSTFNQLYMSEGDGTLREWINDEIWTDVASSAKKDINARFDKLNLK